MGSRTPFLVLAKLRSMLTPKEFAKFVRIRIDTIRGLDFESQVRPEQIGLDPTLSSRSTPSGNRYLVDVLRQLDITDADCILDVGCGKALR